MAEDTTDEFLTAQTRNYIRYAYKTPEIHGSYCPCKDCEKILGPMAQWLHDIGNSPYEVEPE